MPVVVDRKQRIHEAKKNLEQYKPNRHHFVSYDTYEESVDLWRWKVLREADLEPLRSDFKSFEIYSQAHFSWLGEAAVDNLFRKEPDNLLLLLT